MTYDTKTLESMFLILFFEQQKETEKVREYFHLFVHSPNAHEAMMKLGTRNPIKFYPVGSKNSIIQAITLTSQGPC